MSNNENRTNINWYPGHSTGVIENNPLYSWYKSNEENIVIASTVTSSKTTITSNNLTQEEKKVFQI